MKKKFPKVIKGVLVKRSMKTRVQRSNERGQAEHGWLHARFSFSFANYYNPNRMGFGKLVVLNDDIIEPERGFGAHHHDNMEIITIPTKGEVTHEDNMGSKGVIKEGQIQVMSAGKGVVHSEYNNVKDKELRLFQIWIEPNQREVQPRYETKTLQKEKNTFVKIVSGNHKENTLYIHQDASLYWAEFDQDQSRDFKTNEERGTFIMVVEGSVSIEGEELQKRDSIEIEGTKSIAMNIGKGTTLLLIDVPLNENPHLY